MSSTPFLSYIETYFEEQMAVLYPGTFIAFENGVKRYPKNAIWVRFAVITGKTFPASIGKKLIKRTVEVIHVSVFAPEGTGAGPSRLMGDAISELFEFKQMTIGPQHYIKFRAGIVKSGEDPTSGLHRTIATIDGWRDEPKTVPS